MTPQVRGVLMALGAGLCTTIGGACVFFLSTFKRLRLAMTMAISAGVMAYVSFIEIFSESKLSMHRGLAATWGGSMEDPTIEAYAYLFSTLCFFGGWCLTSLMDFGLDLIVQKCNFKEREVEPHSVEALIRSTDGTDSVGVELSASTTEPANVGSELNGITDEICTATAEKNKLNQRCSRATKATTIGADSSAPAEGSSAGNFSVSSEPDSTKSTKVAKCSLATWNPAKRFFAERIARDETEAWEVAHAEECFHKDSRKFLQMGVFTALALTFHNLPEGVATFIGSLSSSQLGFSVAVAIGIHNIPEGFAVSVPLYFGTGRKWSAFFYSVITGFAEPIGALLAWAVLGNNSNPLALGIAFGIVGGIMTNIALKELLPAAYKYDPINEVTTKSFVGGMLIMAFSLVLFQFQE